MQVIYFWGGYLVLMGVAVLAILAATRRLGGSRLRSAFVAFVVAIFVAPSFVTRGYGIGPAWMAAVDARSGLEVLVYGVLPIVVTAAVIFGMLRMVAMLSRRARA